MAKKSTKGRSAPKSADQFIVRMPGGMRDTFARIAAEHGRSMNAEVVCALARYIEFRTAKEEDGSFILSEVGLSQISKRLLAGVNWLEQILYDVRDVDLEAFISDQRSQGLNLTRTEATRKILRDYLEERGYVNQRATEPRE